MIRNIKLTISYDGTAYCGWQIQPNGLTIQEILQTHVSTILRHPAIIIGSGRTDAGVHALGQVAHFHTSVTFDLSRFHRSLNALLPPDIRILHVEEAPEHFHAQYSAVGKTYHYHLHLDKVADPFTRLYRLHVREKIDLALLKQATQYFIGTHDFTSFANEAHRGSAAHDAVRTLTALDIIEQTGGVRLEFTADGFLYKMVRNITGILLEISSGKRPIEEIPKIFSAKDRRQAGKAAPPHGLFLMSVKYP